MPLRAQLNGVDVIAPYISEQEWNSIASEVRSKRATLTLPCCGGNGFLRTSNYGMQHFVHHRNEGCEPESLEHLTAKFEILKACKDLGLTAIPEYRGDGWRTDVFVQSSNLSKFCFEVQLSNQSFDETLRRQRAYEASGVRCCWLFQRLPERSTVLQALSGTEEERRLMSSYGTPMFKLSRLPIFPGQRPMFVVEINGTQRPLRQFVIDLLQRRLRYRLSSVASPVEAVVKIWTAKKRACCKLPFRFFELSEISTKTQCGSEIKITHDSLQDLLPDAYMGFFSKFLRLAGDGYRFPVTKEDDSSAGRSGRPVFGCPCLKTTFTRKPRSKELIGAVNFGLHTTNKFHFGHWCDSGTCKEEAADSFHLEDSLPLLADIEWERD
jgi:hypothetical protein